VKLEEFIHVYDKTLWDMHHRVSASADIIKISGHRSIEGVRGIWPKVTSDQIWNSSFDLQTYTGQIGRRM